MDWITSLLIAIVAGLVCISWLQMRRHKKEAAADTAVRCALCGYARAGLAPEAPCPECGNAPDAALRLGMRRAASPMWGAWCGGIVVLAGIAAMRNGQGGGPSTLLAMGVAGMIPAIPGVLWARLKRMRLTPVARWVLGIGTVAPVVAGMGVVYAMPPGTFYHEAGMLATFAWLACFPLGLVGTVIGTGMAIAVDRRGRRKV